MRHLVVMAAGTGGHVMPGLAVAREMQRRGWRVSWLGTPRGMEHQLVPPESTSGIAMDTIAFDGLRGKGLRQALGGVVRLLRGLGQSAAILRRRQADAVLGMGGYVCLPGGLVAGLLRRPLMLVNADASLLLSNRVLRWVARRIAFGFEGPAARAMPRAVVTGNPVRAEIEALPPPAQRWAGRSGPLRVLVVGGSLGARALNEVLPLALARLEPDRRPRVTHQTGRDHAETVRAAYRAVGLGDDAAVEVVPFIDDMPARLAASDLVVCRAGAITVSELCAAGVPAILVPLVVSTTAHQRDNAQWMAAQDAAFHVPQPECTPPRLAELLRSVHPVGLLAMAIRARNLARPHAAQRVADEIERMVEPR